MRLSDILLAIVVALIWGFNFIALQVGIGSFPPLLFSALRFSIAAFPAILFIRRNGIAWQWILSIGVVLGFGMFSLLIMGMFAGMPAGLTSLVLQVQAVFTALLAAFILRDPPTLWQKIGMLVAFSGIGLIASEMLQSASFLGLVLIVCAGLAWGFSNILIKSAGNVDMFRLTIWMSIVPPIPFLVMSLLFEEGQAEALSGMTWTGAGALLYTALISMVLAFSIWGRLLRRYSPNVVAPFSLLVPVFGMFFAALLLGEQYTATKLAASVLVFSGLFLTVFGGKLPQLVNMMPGKVRDSDRS